MYLKCVSVCCWACIFVRTQRPHNYSKVKTTFFVGPSEFRVISGPLVMFSPYITSGARVRERERERLGLILGFRFRENRK